MADIHPFRGTHYSKSVIQDWSTVICPPYDVISPQFQQELYERSEYNFVRLEYGRELPGDSEKDNKYTRSAATLEQWLKWGVLETDKAPAIYLHDHLFTLEGREFKRRSIIARVRLEEWDRMIVRPHEATMAVTRSDRLSLLRALQANTSPILALFEDRQQQIYAQLARHSQRLPLITSKIVNGEGHFLWAIADAGAINQISKSLAEQPIYVADGHHRYESALTYRAEKGAASSKDAAANFVMMELVDFSQTGLKILPPHRLARGISVVALHNLVGKLAEYFEVEKMPLNGDGKLNQVTGFLAGAEGVRFVIFGPDIDSILTLRLKDPVAASQMMPGSHSELYKKLDVSVVDHIILEKLFGINSTADKDRLAYNHDMLDAVSRVKSGDYQLAILIRPVKPETLQAVSDAGDRMPPKSTYFYPKAPSGLVMNRVL